MRIKPKKSLGQNFLTDKNIQKKIIRACGLTNEDIVLEIGAGYGGFSAQLAPCLKKLYALEIDWRLYPDLEKNLSAYNNCKIIKSDILKFEITGFLQEEKIKQKIKVIGNIPYYISSPIIEHLINYRNNIGEVFMTVQKEFGRRVCAVPGSKEYGSFSCFAQYYARCRVLFEINKRCFNPVPKVDSSFLSLKFREKPAVNVGDETLFFKLIRAAFNQRRKTLRNSLEGLLDRQELERVLDSAGINRNVRPEDLSLEQLANLSNSLKSLQLSVH
ncbi:MAG: 16S rRNA (adenine(1518)-N(6)/adenine(1519)-N(6))-dimethyltransferase RsmA [Candidatus Omnitrophica bacterium]|nr:16S rRNA (adenine(1518)-N(6)/adenine(1519)-N(6))-dimethyltransferase RsmA [Candidatus Omnitrophota bacterium]